MPFLWILWMLARGVVVDAYPYGFANVAELGYGVVARNLVFVLLFALSTPDNVQARNVAETIQPTDPDVLLINEQLLDNPKVDDRRPPTSEGAVEASRLQGGANVGHESPDEQDTADFDDRIGRGPGNVRVDYVLPSRRLKTLDSGVFWPVSSDPLYRLTGAFPFPTSDHRLVWADLRVQPGRSR